MDENTDVQIPVKKIPAFTVIKNGSILKNIFLLRKPPPFSTQESDEEILLVGRHPHCNITLEHPSISRYHLRIESNPSLQKLSVIDLSSVHGTWVSGKRIWPGIPVKLKEGDTVKMGGSSRIYELHWVPLSQAFDVDDPFVPAVFTFKGEEEKNQDENCSCLEKLETRPPEDNLESLNLSPSDQIHHSSVKKLNPHKSSVPTRSNSSCDTDVEHPSPLNDDDEIFSTALVQPPVVASGTISALGDSDSPNKLENQPSWLRGITSDKFELLHYGTVEDPFSVPKSSCDGTQVEQDGSAEILATVSVQAPLVSETTSATEIYDSPNKSEVQRKCSSDIMGNVYEQLSHATIKEDPLSVPNCSNDTEVIKEDPLSVQDPVVAGTISATEISSSLNNSEDLLNRLKENMNDEFEWHNHGTIKDDLYTVPNCSTSHSSPWRNGNENDEICAAVSVQAPLLVSETIHATEFFDNLEKSEDQLNWERGIMSNEFEQLSHGTIEEDPLSVPICSNETEVESLSPLKTGNENGEILATVLVQAPFVDSESISATEIFDSLNQLEDQSNWSSDISNEFEQLSHTIKENPLPVPNCSNDTELVPSSTWKTGNESGENFATDSVQVPLVSESVSATELFDSLSKSEDWLNWSRGITNNEFEQPSHGTNEEDLLSVPICSNDTEVESLSPFKTGNEDGEILATVSVEAPFVVSETISAIEIFDSLNQSESQSKWSRDMSNELEQLSHGTIKENPLSMPNCSNDTELWKTGYENGEIFSTDSVQVPLVVSETVSARELFDSLNKSEDWLNWLEDNMRYDFEQMINGAMKDDLVSVAPLDAIKMPEKVTLNQDIARGNYETDVGSEYEPVGQPKIENSSVPVDLFNSVNRDENGSFMPGKEVSAGCEFEQMDETKMMDLLDDVESKVENDVLCTVIKPRGKEVDMGPPNGKNIDQERTSTPDISKANEVSMNVKAIKKTVSVSTTIFDSLDGNELEIFAPDKENNNPNACSLKKRWKEDVHKQSNHCTMSKEAISPTENEEKDILSFSNNLVTSIEESNSTFTTDGEKIVSDSLLQISPYTADKVDPEEVLFSSLEKETKSRPVKMEGSYNSINYPQTIQKVNDSSHNFLGGEKKGWTMVVDTNSLLDDKSLKHLKLLQGLTRTQLFVPKFVMRELMELKGQHDLLTRNVSLALQWIGECMVDARWWVHVDDDSSEAEPQILEAALYLRKEVTYRNVIILSNDLTLKMKAMAQGVMCESAEDFQRSLVNPFSKRFMWVGSLARGPTWSCVDDDVLRQKYYYGCTLNGLKGLKLLAHFW